MIPSAQDLREAGVEVPNQVPDCANARLEGFGEINVKQDEKDPTVVHISVPLYIDYDWIELSIKI